MSLTALSERLARLSRNVRGGQIFLGFLVAALALAAAVWLHDWKPVTVGFGTLDYHHSRHNWQDAVAVLIAGVGVGAGAAITLPALRVGTRLTIWAAVAFLAVAGASAAGYFVSGRAGRAWFPNIGTGFAILALTITLVEWIVRRAEAERLAPWTKSALKEIGWFYRLVIVAIASDYKGTHQRNAERLPQSSLELLDLCLAHMTDADTKRVVHPGVAQSVVATALQAAAAMHETRKDDWPALPPDLNPAIDEYEKRVKLASTVASAPGMHSPELVASGIDEIVRATREFGRVLVKSDSQYDSDGGLLFRWGLDAPAPVPGS